jgi:hypothetical protein
MIKSAIVALCVFSFSAFGMDAPKCQPKPFDLLKCKSPKLGTVWASFGHVMTSENLDPQFFVVEVGYFSTDANARLEYGTDFKKSMAEAPTRVAPGSGSMIFAVPVESEHGETVTRTIKLTWIQVDRRDEHSFMGNANVVQPGVPEINDLLACTLN